MKASHTPVPLIWKIGYIVMVVVLCENCARSGERRDLVHLKLLSNDTTEIPESLLNRQTCSVISSGCFLGRSIRMEGNSLVVNERALCAVVIEETRQFYQLDSDWWSDQRVQDWPKVLIFLHRGVAYIYKWHGKTREEPSFCSNIDYILHHHSNHLYYDSYDCSTW